MMRPFGYGPVPRGWRQTQLRSFLTRSRRRGRTDLPLLSVNLPQGVVPRFEGDGRPAPSEDLSTYQVVGKGDLVMNQLGKPHGALGVSQHEGIISPAYFVAEIGKDAEPRFVHHLLRTRLYISEYERRGKFMPPSQFDISWEDFRSIPVVMPPGVTQKAIADFLDRETTRIDGLIAAKRRMAELLTEKRRSLIAHFVTHGLDANAPTRDSGIAWLGQIPAHWEVRRLKRIGRSIIGLTFDPADTTADGQGVFVLRASNVKDQEINLDDKLFVRTEIPALLRTRLNDILICARSGSRDLIGKNALINEASEGLTFGAFMTVFRSRYNGFIFYVLNSPLFDYQAGAFSTSTINQLTSETLNAMAVPFPPESEQLDIEAFLRQRCVEIDRLLAVTRRSVGLVQERRQALITAAVTGQLNIPEAA